MSNNSSPNFPATLFPGELSLDESLATMADFVEGLYDLDCFTAVIYY
jgi:hypothetical protein